MRKFVNNQIYHLWTACFQNHNSITQQYQCTVYIQHFSLHVKVSGNASHQSSHKCENCIKSGVNSSSIHKFTLSIILLIIFTAKTRHFKKLHPMLLLTEKIEQLTNVSPRNFNLLVTVDIREKSEAESVAARRIGEPVDAD